MGRATTPTTSLPKGIKSLTEFVNAPLELTARLSQIGLVTQKDGSAIAAKLLPGQRLVSKQGDLWRWDGFCASGNLPSTAAVKLENINKLTEIESGLPELTSKVEAKNTAWEVAKQARQDADNSARTARQVLPDLEREEREAQNHLSQFETDQVRRSEQKTALLDRQARQKSEHEDTLAKLETAKSQLKNASGNQDLENNLAT
ncbi:MAG: hypothetical protein JKX72_10800, partial [Robiginitomaculum sp.]|nr:hypothetical protein [Robiginitomaculum sp.]